MTVLRCESRYRFLCRLFGISSAVVRNVLSHYVFEEAAESTYVLESENGGNLFLACRAVQ